MLPRLLLGGLLTLLLAAPAAPAAQVFPLDLSSPQNAEPGGVAASSAPLRRGTSYVVTISGTGSLWTRDAATEPVTCGAPERAPITQPTPGRPATAATVDAALVFAAPRGVPFLGGFACVPPTPTKPPAQAALLMSSGGPLEPAVPVGGAPAAPAANHTYAYLVKGQGQPLQLQYVDPVVDDNTGILTVTVRTARECRIARCMRTSKRERRPRPWRGGGARGDGRSAHRLPCVLTNLPAPFSAPAPTEQCG